MKKILSAFFVLLLFIGVCVPNIAAQTPNNYYIDSVNGNDANAGTSPAAAWKTVAPVSALTLNPGDGIYFARGGDYECNALTLTCSGTKENPIVISAYGEATDKPHLYTDLHTEVLRLFDCSYITVSDLEITAHNGGGIWIDTYQKESVGITLTDLIMHDMQNVKQKDRDILSEGPAVARACVIVKGLPAHSRYPVNDFTVTDCEMYDVGNGISLWGSWNDAQDPFCETEDIDPVYNKNALVQDVYFHDMTGEAVIVGICQDSLVTNCRAIRCCQDEGVDENGDVMFFAAALWFWGSDHCTIDHCEIAGQKNVGDGMTVDFDSYSHYCTYQYVYSHDNTRFINNCANHDGQHGNSVHHCLSVNDNGGTSRFSKAAGEYEFSFYNNTVINSGSLNFANLYDSKVYNNIFMPQIGCSVLYGVRDLFSGVTGNVFSNNCYSGCLKPIFELNSLNIYPGFVSSDWDDPESFMLAKNSLLIGRGYKKAASVGTDYFGNAIVQNNIGCYGGAGELRSQSFSLKNTFTYLLKRMGIEAK